jgi:5'-methylthioadenosine phosphorylase
VAPDPSPTMIGFIGGSGIYEALELEDTREEHVTTPFGEPSGPITIGTFAATGDEVAFLPRHGAAHSRSPTDLPYRANIYALKELGVERVLATNAVGSLKEELPPRSLVVPDQLFDRTQHRQQTFFNEGIVVHMSVADPFCPHMVEHLAGTAREVTDETVQQGGTYVCIEGPHYSTRAESEFYRAQGWDVVGMTAIPEAKLAREAELCYATVTGVTDYDVWKADAEVTLQEVLENAAANETAIKAVIERAIETMPAERECECHRALEGTINTPAASIEPEARERVALFVDEYLE